MLSRLDRRQRTPARLPMNDCIAFASSFKYLSGTVGLGQNGGEYATSVNPRGGFLRGDLCRYRISVLPHIKPYRRFEVAAPVH
jgi:hypothetical protein